MKKAISMLLVLVMALSLMTACGSPAPAATEAPAAEAENVPMQYISPEDAKGLLENDEYVFFDIRKAADSGVSTVPGAQAWDMDKAKEGDAEAGKATMTEATKDLDKEIILVCYSGKRYAQAATNALSAIGYDMSKVWTLEGGFTAWSEKFPELAVAPGAQVEAEEGGKVLSVDELEKLMAEENVKIFDLRAAEDFEAGHIPGAMNISNKQFENPDNPVDGEIATVEQFEALMSSYGVTADDVIVAYTNASKPQMAPRLIWTLEVYGHTNTYLLDGHYQAWEAAGKAIETGANPAFTAAEYKVIAEDQHTINVNKDDVINKAEGTVLLDVRPTTEYLGEKVADGNARGGHIPGAVNVPYMSTVHENGFFLDKEALTKLYADAGVTADKEIIVYCQRGHRASHSWFVLSHILGFENVKLYDGSMMEWSNLLDQPISTEDEMGAKAEAKPAAAAKTEVTARTVYVDADYVKGVIDGSKPESANYIILDVAYPMTSADYAAYGEGHLPGAVYASIMEVEDATGDNVGAYNLLAAEEIRDYALAHGITKDTAVIMYGPDISGVARQAYAYIYLGVENVKILNGGLEAWKAAGYELETTENKGTAATDFGCAVPAHPEYWTSIEDAKAKLESDPNFKLVSIRSEAEWRGETSGYGYMDKAGEPKGAVWGKGAQSASDVADFTNPDGTVKDFAGVTAVWEGCNFTLDNHLAFYCGTGWRATVPFLVLYQEGYDNISLYDGGWYQWLMDDSNPVQVGDPDDCEVEYTTVGKLPTGKAAK